MSELTPSITIPLPMSIEKQRGILATCGPDGCLVQYRGTDTEKNRIKQAAAALGISYGSFMRCVVNDAADAVLKMKQE